ncbi:MAG: NADH:flavin oxidoreductase [Bacteroidetes bacterium]|nr:NADH:flavin oxidoreductase [Bacteroidota bacterium]
MNSDILFEPLELRNVTLPNRLVRSATYEGMGDDDGFPMQGLTKMYLDLAEGGIGTIITGFVFTSWQGRAMHPGQCGINSEDKESVWLGIIAPILNRFPDAKLFMQIAHAGRQTLRRMTNLEVVGATSRKCSYFRQSVSALGDADIMKITDGFGKAAHRAMNAGFHGVQIQGAHGYLIHQFLSPWTNRRKDRWGKDRVLFLSEVFQAIKSYCGKDFPVLVKLSAADDRGLTWEETAGTVAQLKILGADGVEISYGTMEYALNIIRGECPVDTVLQVNPLFNRIPIPLRNLWKLCCKGRYIRKFKPFTPDYNREAAAYIKRETGMPVITVGGLRTALDMVESVTRYGLDGVALCRPLIKEPDIPAQLKRGDFEQSQCTNCNLCTIHCDGHGPTRCYI